MTRGVYPSKGRNEWKKHQKLEIAQFITYCCCRRTAWCGQSLTSTVEGFRRFAAALRELAALPIARPSTTPTRIHPCRRPIHHGRSSQACTPHAASAYAVAYHTATTHDCALLCTRKSAVACATTRHDAPRSSRHDLSSFPSSSQHASTPNSGHLERPRNPLRRCKFCSCTYRRRSARGSPSTGTQSHRSRLPRGQSTSRTAPVCTRPEFASSS
jgi:hypothetical protein